MWDLVQVYGCVAGSGLQGTIRRWLATHQALLQII